MTAVSDIAPAPRLGQAMGYAGLAELVTNAVSPAIVEPLAATHGWTWCFLLSGGCALVAVGRTISLIYAAFNGGMGLSVVALGELAVRVGYPPVYGIAGTGIVATVIVLSRMAPESSKNSHRPACR